MTRKPSFARAVHGVVLLALSALFAAAPAAAQASAGVRLMPVAQLRGPFQHVVVGGSVVAENGSVVPSANGTVRLPAGSRPYLTRLFWMGSGDAPDVDVTLRLPGGAAVPVSVDAASCLLINAGSDVDPVRYWMCETEVTSRVAALPSLDGEYGIEGLTPSTGAPWSSVQGFVGAFALVIVYVDPADASPRALQISRGLFHGRHRGDYAARGLLPVETPVSSGRATVVALEGDEELPADGECTGNLVNRTCDFLGFCNDDCVDVENATLIPENVLFTLHNADNPPGNIFNETVSTEIEGSVGGIDAVERNALDIDTFDLAGRLPPGMYTDLRAVVQTGSDAVLQALLVVELFDLDSDGDGLSDLQEEQETGTDPLRPDSDGDGIGDGAEVFGKSLADPRSNPTDPLHPDSDRDGLCDGAVDVDEVCVGGEDLSADGARDPGETDPNAADTDRDGLPDALERLFGAYGDPLSPRQTSPLDSDSDDDGRLDGDEDLDRSGTFDPAANETDPTVADTDGGGADDGDEIRAGTDPLDPSDDLPPEVDAGPVEEDAGWTEDDAGSLEEDAGWSEDDAGPVEEDAGWSEDDAGAVDEDAGWSDEDAGWSDEDAGALPDGGTADAGAPDGGVSGGDAGARADAGDAPPASDAGDHDDTDAPPSSDDVPEPLTLTGSTVWSCASTSDARGALPLVLLLGALALRRRASGPGAHVRG